MKKLNFYNKITVNIHMNKIIVNMSKKRRASNCKEWYNLNVTLYLYRRFESRVYYEEMVHCFLHWLC